MLNHVEVINFGANVNDKVFQFVCYERIALFDGLDVVTLVRAMDHALTADGRSHALKAEVVHLFIRMSFTGFSLNAVS